MLSRHGACTLYHTRLFKRRTPNSTIKGVSRSLVYAYNGVVAIKQPIATIELTDSLTHVSPLIYVCARNFTMSQSPFAPFSFIS